MSRRHTHAIRQETEKVARGNAKDGRVFVAFHIPKADWDLIRQGATPRGFTVSAYCKAFVLQNRDRLAAPPDAHSGA